MLPVDPIHEEALAFVATPVLALLTRFLPDRTTLALEAWHGDEAAAQITLDTISTRSQGSCPLCHVQTTRVHSRSTRTVADVPWGASAVRLHLRVRQFFCDHPTCPRQSFTERLPAVVAPWVRRTLRRAQHLSALGSALGGQAGARLAARFQWRTSSDTLLRLVQAAPAPAAPAPQGIGVDEWAWRRGQRYGTIVVNLEDHRVLDLLPERSAAAVAAWLAQHPTLQVVDRLHLVKNLCEATEAFLHHQRPALQAAATRTAQALTRVAGVGPGTRMYRGRPQSGPARPRVAAAAPQPRHLTWGTLYEAVHTLHGQGTPVATIAQQLGSSRPTVYADRRRTTPPSPRSPQRSGQVLQPSMAYLVRRWREGCTDSKPLWRERRALGYTHSARTVSRFITRLRRASEAGQAPETQVSPYMRPQGRSARAVSFAFVCPIAKRSLDAQLYLDQLCEVDTRIAQAHTLVQAFLGLVRERRGCDLDVWRAEVTQSGIAELARFAHGLQEDRSAMTAGLTLEWSNGVTEGQIHRLKLLKRQGDGRAGVALLRQRVRLAA